ncbi:voltage-dependent calcium channel subunit alpha-2/delta-3-like isoform X1 [Diadema antillarum]|uniref:voltage-dependent calcium channel subunit alpha-2/delta-3-like isoform X1 n=1 Tax=Diadema antillarum TaxID=105358 RepID=UPI003A88EFF5
MANNMQAMLQDKARAVERIVAAAENGFLLHEYDNQTDYTYYNGVLVNTNASSSGDDPEDALRKQLDVTPDSHFDDIPINITISTVQVPTNVFNQGAGILNSIEATETLNEVYLDNYQHDPTLTWQYFGSKTGYFRVYPGYKWPLNHQNLDLYDCRVRGWYVEGATSSKDVVILVDVSGSMTGLYVEIAKYAIKKILDTFGDNDFVNVISFNDQTRFIQPCFNDTMVQATSDNKNLIKSALSSLVPYGMADLQRAVRHAFDLLESFNSTGRGSGCNQAIMILSDMLTETAEDVFREHNPNQTVRVFTYQTGREKDGPTNLVKIACSNKGYYTRLATISDVEEQVTSYLHVLSRPMVNERIRKTVWSSVYHDALGLGLTTTVSQPVFNIRNDTMDMGVLEGVAGTDVPIVEMKKFTPPFQLGVNGYSYAITNNGYILFHPDLRPLHGDGLIKPNYNSVDLSEVELSDTDDVASLPRNSLELPENQLRDSMVRRETGVYEMVIKQMFDDLKRVSSRRNKYYYTLLAHTPYSLGISLPEAYDNQRLQTPELFVNSSEDGQFEYRAEICDIQQAAKLLFGDGTLGQTIIANWLYCKINYSSSERYEGEEHVVRFLQDAAMHDGKLNDFCDAVMVNHLIFDANVTRFMPEYWKLVFRAPDTSGLGLNNLAHSIQEIVAEIEEYCSPGVTTVSNFNTSDTEATTADTHSTTESVTARYTTATPVTESIPFVNFPHLDPSSDGVILSFLGTYGGLTRIYHNPHISTYLSDFSDREKQNTIEEGYFTRAVEEIDDGFVFSVPFESELAGIETVVTASTAIRVEKDSKEFAAAAAGYQMLGSALRSLFFNITSSVPDCDPECTPSCFNDSVECFLVDNHGYIVVSTDMTRAGTHFAAHEENLRLFNKLVDRDIFEVVHVTDYQGMCRREIIGSAAPSLRNSLENFLSILHWFAKQVIVFLSQISIYDWLSAAVAQTDERYTYEPCDQEYTFYVANRSNLPEKGLAGKFLTNCTDCFKPYSVQSVPHSNLMLIIQERDCECFSDQSVQLEPDEIEYNETAWCERLLQFRNRSKPDTCFHYDPNEDSSECGRGFIHSPSFLLIVASFLLTAVGRPH